MANSFGESGKANIKKTVNVSYDPSFVGNLKQYNDSKVKEKLKIVEELLKDGDFGKLENCYDDHYLNRRMEGLKAIFPICRG